MDIFQITHEEVDNFDCDLIIFASSDYNQIVKQIRVMGFDAELLPKFNIS